jgi:hypothetical protein
MKILHTHRLLCDCNAMFSYVRTDDLSFLEVGVLEATDCTFDGYVIDWYLNSEGDTIELTTGAGEDDAIQIQHPLYEPVEGGTWIPRIRYVIIDGIRYYTKGEDRCVLNSIVVDMLSCTNGVAGVWTHTVSYVNTLDLAEKKDRSFRFSLNEVDLVEHIGWRFYGFSIGDRFQMYYVSGATETLLEDWVIGADCPVFRTTPLPKMYQTEHLESITDLRGFTHVANDYLKFVITASYNSPSNLNTNWVLNLKCFTVSDPFSWFLHEAEMHDIDVTTNVPTLTWDATNCRWVCLVHTMSSGYSSTNYNNLDIMNYLNIQQSWNGDGVVDYYDDHITIYLNQNTVASWARNWSSSCSDTTGITLSKTGTTLLYQFSTIAEYNTYKNSYDTRTATVPFTVYDSNNTSHLHYTGLYELFYISTSCGDAFTFVGVDIHYSSVFTWDSGTLTCSIVLGEVTNGYPATSCDTTDEHALSATTAYNNFRNLADFSYTTNRISSNPFGFSSITRATTNMTEKIFFLRVTTDPAYLLPTVRDFQEEWCEFGNPASVTLTSGGAGYTSTTLNIYQGGFDTGKDAVVVLSGGVVVSISSLSGTPAASNGGTVGVGQLRQGVTWNGATITIDTITNPVPHYFKCLLYLIVTDVGDPANNFQLWQGLTAAGCPGEWNLIYEVP